MNALKYCVNGKQKSVINGEYGMDKLMEENSISFIPYTPLEYYSFVANLLVLNRF